LGLAVVFKFPPDGAILLIGPPLSGSKEMLFSYVAAALADKRGVTFVTTDAAPEELKRELVGRKIFFGTQIRFIDCYSPLAEESAPDSPGVKRVSGPLAFNELSVAISEAEREFAADGKKHALVFNSLSTLLMYSNAEAVGRFAQVIVAKAKKTGGALFTIEQGMHDEKTIVMMEHLMDAVVEARAEAGRVLVRARGIPGCEDWAPL